jgi:membrane fusion protein
MLIIALAAFLFLGSYTRRIRVEGVLVPDTGLITLKARSEGVLQGGNLSISAPVHDGQKIATIVGEMQSSSLGDTNALIAGELRERERELKAQGALRGESSTLLLGELQKQLALLAKRRKEIAEQVEHKKKQIEIQGDLLRRMETLSEQKYVSVFEQRRQELSKSSAEADLSALRAQLPELDRQIGDVRLQINQRPADLSAEIGALQQQRADTLRLLADTEQERSSVVVSPIDGKVANIFVKPGQQLSVGQPIASILPNGSTLSAQLFVTSESVGLLKRGQRVAIQLQAFPYQKFGLRHGRISSISQSVGTARQSEGASASDANPDQPFYKVIVGLDRQSTRVYGRDVALMPGMDLKADLMLERRTVFEWLFESAYGFRQALATE